MHLNSKLLFQKYAQPLFAGGLRVLEIGPDAIPSAYQEMVNDPTISWETLDFVHVGGVDHTTIDGYRFPIKTGTYDIVVSGQVIEHVGKIWVWIHEVARVCKAGGIIITISPVNWEYHEAPIDCWRIGGATAARHASHTEPE